MKTPSHSVIEKKKSIKKMADINFNDFKIQDQNRLYVYGIWD